MNPLFSLRELTFSYPGQGESALAGVDLDVAPGEFLLLCGPSGCGKSTLLRQLKPLLTPNGTRAGEVLFDGEPLARLDQRRQAQEIGFVLQSPENQIVTDKVWHELAFGLESLGYDTPTIRRRVAEMASFFGIQSWFHKDVNQLSGGQKQLLNLASVMVMQPRVLILDEPTSQLDPIAAAELLAAVSRINRELGTTVVLTEHRLEDAFPLASRVVVMERGRVRFAGAPREVGPALKREGHAMFLAMPTATRIWASTPDAGEPCPVTVLEGRDWLAGYARSHPLGEVPPEPVRTYPPDPAIRAEDLWFRYEQGGEDVVKGISLTVQPGELLALMGGNGVGKSTLLKLLAGVLEPYRGTVSRSGPVGLLPQDPKTLFVRKTLGEDLMDTLRDSGLEQMAREDKLAQVVTLCRLTGLLGRHPYDLSGGEQQRAALAKVLLTEPRLLLMDEPTKGLDAQFKEVFAHILQTLSNQGVTILMASHDITFCARHAHRCALVFDGDVVNTAAPRAFFGGNRFYTTPANRMARELLPQAVTAHDVIAACGGEEPKAREVPDSGGALAPVSSRPNAPQPPGKLPGWRKGVAAVAAAVSLVLLLQFLGLVELGGLMAWVGFTNGARRQLAYYGVFSLSLIVLALSLARPASILPTPAPKKGKLSKRARLSVLLVLLLIPLTLLAGELYLDSRKYYVICLLIMLECMIPFFLVFEGRKPQARELVILAVLCAIGVAGRQVFFMLPEFKPVIALVVVTGIALGGESGFLVGAMTMLLSNMMFQQGPWTPWQMFAMGLVGFLSGALFRAGVLRRSRWCMCTFGALASIVVYGGIMNLQSALTWTVDLNWRIFVSYYVTGFPMDCVHAAATWVFLWFGGEAMLEKLDRVKVKYGE